MNKKIVAGAAAVAIIMGGGAAATLTVAGAQTGSGGSTTTTAPASGRPDRGAAQKSALDPLVQDGTITQDQEDKVLGALAQAAPKGLGGPSAFGAIGGLIGQGEDTVAQALGITTDQLKTDLKNGQSIADIATAQGVDLSKVEQAITDAANAKVDAAVTAGKLTQDQADKIKANEAKMIDALVNGKLPFAGAMGGFGGHGFGAGKGHGAPPSSTTSTTTN